MNTTSEPSKDNMNLDLVDQSGTHVEYKQIANTMNIVNNS
ncbi:MAG: hypothetical protein ACD_49C00009G0001, partial [uncultured bacterium (gcode 4)]